MHAAGVPILAGSDSLDPFNYPGSSLHEELRLLVQAGFTPMEALQTATSNPARFLKRNLGALASDHLADLVILDANPLDDIANTERIHAVVQNGRVFDRAALDRLLAQARALAQPLRRARRPTPFRRVVSTQAYSEPIRLSEYGAFGSSRRCAAASRRFDESIHRG